MGGVTLPEAAAAYAARGWAVFPCKPRGKIPATAHGVKDATTDADRVREWWILQPDANIGLAAGAASRILAVDLDGEEGAETWRDLTAGRGHVATLTARTGSGGWHFLYRLPASTNVRNTARRLGPGVDTRGDGGYIVIAPSVHPSGGVYEWVDDRDPVRAPSWILDRLAPPAKRSGGPPAVMRPYTSGDGTRYGHAALTRITLEVATATRGNRNDTLNTAAFTLGRLIAGGELTPAAVQALTDAAAAAGLSNGEINATINSGLKAGYGHPIAAR